MKCEITKHGSFIDFLRHFKGNRKKLNSGKSLRFYIDKNGTPSSLPEQKYSVLWKVLNRGEAAKIRDYIRGQIVADLGLQNQKTETADFNGEHMLSDIIQKRHCCGS